MTDIDNICEYFIWWPDKDKDPNKQVCPNWAPSDRWMFDDEDDENNLHKTLSRAFDRNTS